MINKLFKGISEADGSEVIGQLLEDEERGICLIFPSFEVVSPGGTRYKGACSMVRGGIYVRPQTVEEYTPLPVLENTRFSFLYRDASNYKTYNSVVLKGRLTAEEIEEIFNCGEGGMFISEQVGIMHEFPGPINDDDHCWCEFFEDKDHGFEATNEKPTYEIDAHWLLNNFRAAKNHWDVVTYMPIPEYCDEDEEDD